MTSPSKHSLDSNTQTRVLRLRIKDKHADWLDARSREVNYVWNFCNEHSMKVLKRERRFVSGFDLHAYTKGASAAGLELHSQTLQAIGEEYARRRSQFKKQRLRWRVSRGPRRSLGWVPFKAAALHYRNGQVFLGKQPLSLWDSYGLADYELGSGNISQDRRGRWYLNVCVKVKVVAGEGRQALGIDLGLKECATVSDGQKLVGRWYRQEERALGRAQRAGKKKRVRAIHAKIAHRRKDAMRKLSTKLVGQSAAIFVGNVASAKLVKTKMAKSTLDAGWAMFKTMLGYKCRGAGVVFEQVNEAWSTQTCSACGRVEGPKGRAQLRVREWTCSCGARHDRDVNAALNIRAKGLENLNVSAPGEVKACEAGVNEAKAEAGHGLPAGGIPVPKGGEDVKL